MFRGLRFGVEEVPRAMSRLGATAGSRALSRVPTLTHFGALVLCIRAFAVKVATKRLSVFPFSGLLKGCKGHKTHRFENGGTNQTHTASSSHLNWL